jgi:hypothetical protein
LIHPAFLVEERGQAGLLPGPSLVGIPGDSRVSTDDYPVPFLTEFRDPFNIGNSGGKFLDQMMGLVVGTKKRIDRRGNSWR